MGFEESDVKSEDSAVKLPARIKFNSSSSLLYFNSYFTKLFMHRLIGIDLQKYDQESIRNQSKSSKIFRFPIVEYEAKISALGAGYTARQVLNM